MRRRGHDNTDYLFWPDDFHAVQEAYRERLKRTIDDANAALVEDGTVDDVGARFAEQFRLEAPELTEGATSVDIEETRVDVTESQASADPGESRFRSGVAMTPDITSNIRPSCSTCWWTQSRC
jgi:hypothetical protein